MPVSDQQVNYFVEDLLKYVPDKNSPDVTLHAFQTIEHSDNFGPRHAVLRKADPGVNARIAQMIKKLLGRENDEEIPVSRSECSLIKSYTRFKP